MTRSMNLRRSLALTSALVVASWGAAAVPATAETGSATSAQSQHAAAGQHHGQGRDQSAEQADGKGAGKRQDGDKGHEGGTRGQSGSHAQNGTHAPAGSKGGNQGGTKQGDPAGNNGTVKIAPLGEMDGIPQNSPHPGCTFQIEWYGFDQGDDIISTVGFAMQAPTSDVALSVDGPATVFVGGDPASGAGTDTGLDGVQAYTLSFDGAPQPKQGYHVKLTVHTPRSQGNDTKTKVFWVEPCETTPVVSGDTGDTGTGTDTGDTDTGVGAAGAGDQIEVLGAQASTGSAGAAGSLTEVSPPQAQAAQAGNGAVPTAVEAGENGQSAFGDFVRSPLPLLVVGLGALLAAAAFVMRRRSRAQLGA